MLRRSAQRPNRGNVEAGCRNRCSQHWLGASAAESAAVCLVGSWATHFRFIDCIGERDCSPRSGVTVAAGDADREEAEKRWSASIRIMPARVRADHPLNRLFAELVDRHVVRAAGISDPEMTSYVASLLVDFTYTDHLYRIRNVRGR